MGRRKRGWKLVLIISFDPPINYSGPESSSRPRVRKARPPKETGACRQDGRTMSARRDPPCRTRRLVARVLRFLLVAAGIVGVSVGAVLWMTDSDRGRRSSGARRRATPVSGTPARRAQA